MSIEDLPILADNKAFTAVMFRAMPNLLDDIENAMSNMVKGDLERGDISSDLAAYLDVRFKEHFASVKAKSMEKFWNVETDNEEKND